MNAYTTAPVADWRTDPRARILLASFKRFPLDATTRFVAYVLTRDEYVMYEGYRVDCLEKVYAEHFARVKTPATADGDWSQFDAFMAQPNVQDAIYEAQNPDQTEPSLWDTMMSDVVGSLRPMGSVAAC